MLQNFKECQFYRITLGDCFCKHKYLCNFCESATFLIRFPCMKTTLGYLKGVIYVSQNGQIQKVQDEIEKSNGSYTFFFNKSACKKLNLVSLNSLKRPNRLGSFHLFYFLRRDSGNHFLCKKGNLYFFEMGLEITLKLVGKHLSNQPWNVRNA